MIRSKFQVISLAVLIALSAVRSFGDPRPPVSSYSLPSLSTDEQKLKYLTYLHEHLPSLFEDAARYEVNLFEMLTDQEALDSLLNKIPGFKEKVANRPEPAKFRTEVLETVASKSVRIRTEAVSGWKSELHNCIEKLPQGQNLVQHLNSLNAQLGKMSSQSVFSALVSQLPSSELKASLRGKSPAERIKILISHLPANLSDRFRAAELGLKAPVSSAQAIELFEKVSQLETEIANFRSIQILLHSRNSNLAFDKIVNGSDAAKQARSIIAESSVEDLEGLTDPDLVESALKRLQLQGGELDAATKAIQSRAKSFTLQTEEFTTEIKGALTLIEAPPGVAIFRGCTGGDCSSQYSFPYPNDPNERVFFVMGEHGRLKGYLSGTVVEMGGKPVFYAMTLSGARISGDDARVVLRSLTEMKSHLGVQAIALPNAGSLDGLLNFTEVRSVYEELVKNRSASAVRYRDQKIRNKIEAYKSKYNTGEYDHSGNNSTAILLKDEDLNTLVPNVKTTKSRLTDFWKYSDRPLNRQALFLFAMDLKSSGRDSELKIVLEALGIQQAEFSKYNSVLQNEARLPLAEYEKKFQAEADRIARHYKIPSPSNEQLNRFLEYGFLNANDLFSDSNRARSNLYFQKAIKEASGEDADEKLASRLCLALSEHVESFPRESPLIQFVMKTLGNDPSLVSEIRLAKTKEQILERLVFEPKLREGTAHYMPQQPLELFEKLFRDVQQPPGFWVNLVKKNEELPRWAADKIGYLIYEGAVTRKVLNELMMSSPSRFPERFREELLIIAALKAGAKDPEDYSSAMVELLYGWKGLEHDAIDIFRRAFREADFQFPKRPTGAVAPKWLENTLRSEMVWGQFSLSNLKKIYEADPDLLGDEVFKGLFESSYDTWVNSASKGGNPEHNSFWKMGQSQIEFIPERFRKPGWENLYFGLLPGLSLKAPDGYSYKGEFFRNLRQKIIDSKKLPYEAIEPIITYFESSNWTVNWKEVIPGITGAQLDEHNAKNIQLLNRWKNWAFSDPKKSLEFVEKHQKFFNEMLPLAFESDALQKVPGDPSVNASQFQKYVQELRKAEQGLPMEDRLAISKTIETLELRSKKTLSDLDRIRTNKTLPCQNGVKTAISNLLQPPAQ